MNKRKQYTSQFKREAVRLMENSEKSASDIARQLGVRRNRLYKWKEQLEKRGAKAKDCATEAPNEQEGITLCKSIH